MRGPELAFSTGAAEVSAWAEEPVLPVFGLVAGRPARRLEFVQGAGDREAALHEEFTALADTWAEETAAKSLLQQKAIHWGYQRIIGMGPEALPWILERLRSEKNPDHWFWALVAITGEDPAENAVSLSEAAEKWLAWGASKALV